MIQMGSYYDDRPNLPSKLGASQLFSRKITRSCVPLMITRLGLHWDASSMQSLVYCMVPTMVVENNIAGIESHDEYEELCSVRPRARAGEMIMPFILVQDNGAEEDDEKFLHAKHATFGMQGPSVPSPPFSGLCSASYY